MLYNIIQYNIMQYNILYDTNQQNAHFLYQFFNVQLFCVFYIFRARGCFFRKRDMCTVTVLYGTVVHSYGTVRCTVMHSYGTVRYGTLYSSVQLRYCTVRCTVMYSYGTVRYVVQLCTVTVRYVVHASVFLDQNVYTDACKTHCTVLVCTAVLQKRRIFLTILHAVITQKTTSLSSW